MDTTPVAHWYWKDESNIWLPYDEPNHQAIELAYTSGQSEILIGAGKYRVNFPHRKQINNATGFNRDVRRGTWFWVENENTAYVPYPEDVSVLLETSWKEGKFDNYKIAIGNGRYVILRADGSTRQYRESGARNMAGRAVLRGYNNQVQKTTSPYQQTVVQQTTAYQPTQGVQYQTMVQTTPGVQTYQTSVTTPGVQAYQTSVTTPGVQAYQTTPGVQAYQTSVTTPGVQAYQTTPGVQAYQTTPGVQAYQTSVTTPGVQAYQTIPGVQAYQTTPGVQAYQTPVGVQTGYPPGLLQTTYQPPPQGVAYEVQTGYPPQGAYPQPPAYTFQPVYQAPGGQHY